MSSDPILPLASTSSLVNNESDDSDSSNSLFKTQCDPISPSRETRNISTCNTIHLPPNTWLRDYSSDSSSELEPFNLKVVFENWKKKKRKIQKKKRKYKPSGRPKGRPKGSTKTTQSLAVMSKKDLFKDKGLQFPLVESENGRKPLLWKKILGFEQAVARGFFNYVKEQKYESHLREALKHLGASEDLDKEDFGVRRYKYLEDDDESISPIEDSNAEYNQLDDQDDCDVKLVDNSCFIISTELPEKTKSKMKKTAKD
ncbi:TATA box-binding protein-associated factor RNA polymerase I subunit D [Monodelphis domestica]|uniref:TATA box-binding protein-associated factor RNA polymerase I subunit D n=1 Tax=Monodelphis domestica TaxID=13616 RepID=UPI0024E24261|nr:TATA box-binding protein-associated factor RNA polymerase I subunit D [Monodelphis domestica]XP_007495067.2 TATA box-binding protein-associated factor RNA polymerase I subunit D [Monodelphis domestica]XP_007495068.2 TATA box-binding protein-associated factor RNA polymerase I subunit D [Monodelphis domestica]XP_016289395.2 TATA box-binding protein-associated factor RNA polymerase I subunit D [Monodelphis domestica]